MLYLREKSAKSLVAAPSDQDIDMIIVSRPPPASPYVQTVPHLNWLTALPSYEGRAAVEGVK
jgi:hypothetical protein